MMYDGEVLLGRISTPNTAAKKPPGCINMGNTCGAVHMAWP